MGERDLIDTGRGYKVTRRFFEKEGDMSAAKLDSIQWSPACHPSASTYRKVAPHRPDPAWERGVLTSDRPDGSRMPIVDHNLEPIALKDLANNRSEIEGKLRQRGAN